MAILVEAVNYVARERDLDAHVFDRVLGFSRFPKIVFRILCHLEWGFMLLFLMGVPISFLIGSRGPYALYKVILGDRDPKSNLEI